MHDTRLVVASVRKGMWKSRRWGEMETGKGNWKRRLKAEIVISDFLAADLQWLSLLHIPEHSPSPVFKLYCVVLYCTVPLD